VSGLTLGFLSHVLAGVSPFVMAAVIARAGLLPGTALAYACGTGVLVVALGVTPLRRTLREGTRRLAAPHARLRFIGALLGFLVAGVTYYHGLTASARIAEYVFLTRLDWLVQAPVALVLLGEPWTRRGVVGAGLALTGGLLLTASGAIGTSGLIFALLYIAASLVGYVCATPLSSRHGTQAAVTLTMWRHWVNTGGFVLLALVAGRAGPALTAPATFALAGVASLILIGLFLARFAALTRLPLWMLSAQAPVQALVAVLASLLSEGRLPLASAAAITLVVAGEWLVMARQPREATRTPAAR